MKSRIFYFFMVSAVVLAISSCKQPQKRQTAFANGETLSEFFKYEGDGSILISGHRGAWLHTEYPDNSLEGLQYATKVVPGIFFEVDPRLTRDSVIVLMHDATLDRTTNATGKLIDYSWEELDSVRLRDYTGDVTSFQIPTLEEAIRWSIGKTVLNLDRKDVPREMIVELIRQCGAEKNIMLTVHTGEQMRYYYERMPDVMFSARIRNEEEYEDMAAAGARMGLDPELAEQLARHTLSAAGVPWKNMIAYVGPTVDERNAELVEKLHAHGVRCMISVAPTHDRLESAEERAVKYREEILCGADIIETDIPQELWGVLQQVKSEK